MRTATVQEAINGNNNETVITPLRLKQVLSELDLSSGGGGSGGITKETDPIFKSSPAAGITTSNIASWNAKQNALVSGQNIKTINGQDILGEGDITIESGSSSETPEVSIGPSTPTSGEKVWFQPLGNLFNKNTMVDGGRLLSNGNVQTWNNNCCCSDFIEVQPNTQYTLSGGTQNSGVTIPYYNCYYDENKNCIGNFLVASGTQTITTPANAKYMRFTVYNVDKNKFQFEKGSVATAYKPYSPKQSINVLNGTVYEEFLNVDNLLTKDDNIIIEEKDPTVPAHVKSITQADIDNWNRGTGGGSDYTLPIASKDTLGGIKVGSNLYIEEDGTLNAVGGGTGDGSLDPVPINSIFDYDGDTVPDGFVKVSDTNSGNNIIVDGDGAIISTEESNGTYMWIHNSGTFTLEANTITKIPFDTVVSDTSNGKLIHENGGIRIGKGVKQILVLTKWNNWTYQCQKYVYVYKNGVLHEASGYPTGAWTANVVSYVDVQEGDFIETYGYHNYSSSLGIASNSAQSGLKVIVLSETTNVEVTGTGGGSGSGSSNIAISPTEPLTGEEVWFQTRENLFDVDTVTPGTFVDSTGALLTDSDVWYLSDYIAVEPNEQYTYRGLLTPGTRPHWAYYDANKNYVSSLKQTTGINTITIPDGVAFIRCSLYLYDLNTFRFEKCTSEEVIDKNNIYVLNSKNKYEKFSNDLFFEEHIENTDVLGTSHYVIIGTTLICMGRVAVPSQTNTVTTLTLPYPKEFAYTPIVSITAQTSVPYATEKGAGAATDTKNLTIYHVRGNTTATNYFWLAIGKLKA